MTMRSIYAVCALPAALSGCISYAPADASAMTTYRICEIQANQRPNLTAESQRLLQSELARRKESCAAYTAPINAARDAEFYDQVYRNQSP